MVDANHGFAIHDALALGRELARLGVYWFEEPVAPEDRAGYRELRAKLAVNIAGGEAEFTRWGFRDLIDGRCVDILQPEVCGLGGITEYRRVLALAQAQLIPVINHVWGSGVALATNLQLLLALPDMPGGAHPESPYLEYDTTPNRFKDGVLVRPLDIDDRTVLHLLTSLQYLGRPGEDGGGRQAVRLSFKGLGVEQIGHVYEGLLDHTAVRAKGPMLGLCDPDGETGRFLRACGTPHVAALEDRDAIRRTLSDFISCIRRGDWHQPSDQTVERWSRRRRTEEFAELVASCVPGTKIEEREADSFRPERDALSIERASKELGFEPKIDLEDGIPAYVEFVRRTLEQAEERS